VQLRLDLSGVQQRRAYRATVDNSAGLQVWSGQVENPASRGAGPSVSVTLPSRILPNDQYELALSEPGTSEQTGKLAGYHFSIARR